MAKLTDTQLLVLTSASQQNAGVATRPDRLNTTAAAKVAATLIDRGYMRECVAKIGWPIWRNDDKGKVYGLKILKAGRIALKAIGDHKRPAKNMGEAPKPIATAMHPVEIVLDAPRPSSKIAGILVLLDDAEGASTSEMIAATGCQTSIES